MISCATQVDIDLVQSLSLSFFVFIKELGLAS